MRTMDLDELTAALAGPKPDREAVLTSFQRKHRKEKTKRRLWWAGGLAACAAVVLTVATMSQPQPRGSVTLSPAGCAPGPLAQSLAQARQDGASILLAYGSPTGETSGSRYQAVVLRSVHMLSGPAIASGTTAWSDGTTLSGRLGATGTAAGQLLAIAWPAAVAGSTVGPVVHTAPVRDGNVILTRSGCQDMTSLAAVPSSGQGIAPGGGPAPDGLYAIPLPFVEQAAASPLTAASGGGQASPSSGGTTTATPSPTAGPGNGTANGNSNGNGSANGKAKGKAKKAAASAAASAASATATAKGKGKAKGKAKKAAAAASATSEGGGNGNGNG